MQLSGPVRRFGAHSFLLTIAAFFAASPGTWAQNYGIEGPSYTGALSTPTASKPESKLWFNDGLWWGSLWHPTALRYRIHQLDLATQTWVDTGVNIDTRKSSLQDALWDGQKLYLASHEFTESLPTSGKPGRLYRFSYDPATKQYALDSGFPAAINNFSTETLVIDKDSTGTLWATWAQNNQVYVNCTLGSDSSWGTPFVLPVSTSVSPDDLSSLIHFNGDRIGVMWSDQVTFKFYFSVHLDGDPADTWSAPEELALGSYLSDDHINLKATADGRVYSVLKTFTNEIILAIRYLSGSWSYHLVSTDGDRLTRPIVLIDEGGEQLHVFASSPETGGTIFQKTSSLNSISFVSGQGTPVMYDADHLKMNNATSTKQNLSPATGLVVLGSNQDTRRYWFSYSPIAEPQPPVASFNAGPVSGISPVVVSFTDTTTGGPSSWSWDFGDGTSSNLQHPSHTYVTPGTYSVTLTATNAIDSSTVTQVDLISVQPTPPVVTLNPVADANVKSSSPNSNYGEATTFRVRFSSTETHRSYLRFVVLEGSSIITGARLRLFCTDSGSDGGTVYLVGDNSWGETSITWNNAPPITGSPVGSFGSVVLGNYVELNLSSIITGPGTYTLGMSSASSDSVFYSSREGTNPPELLVFSASDPPVASFNADPVTGTAPLLVNFTDTSTGSPTSWLWDFGDGTTSTLQNPSHTYVDQGTYSVSLTATNAIGPGTITQPDLLDVQPAPPVVTFNAAADANVRSSSVNSNYGTATTIRVKFSSTDTYRSYIKFVVAVGSNPIVSAKLRLFCTDGSADGGTVYLVDSSWTESTITWNNAPPITGSPVGSFGSVVAGDFVETDVSAAITAPGTYTLAMLSASSDSALYSSKEGGTPPQLEVFCSSDPPMPSFTANPLAGFAPLQVDFTDTTTGSPTSWLWDFGDGNTSNEQHPSHAYTTAGLYSVSLTSTNVNGSNSITQFDLINVQAALPVVTFSPVADANVKSNSPSSNYGSLTTIRVKESSTEIQHSYIRFVVEPETLSVASVKLRLFCTDASPDGGTVYLVDNVWSENTITWSNAPPITGTPVGSFGNVALNAWVELDLSSVITAPGTYTLGMISASTNSALYSSREGADPPQLEVTYQN